MGTISFETLQRRIKQIGDIATLEPAVKRVAGQSIRRLVLRTNKRTGNTRRAWTTPKKIGRAAYEVENNAVTEATKAGKRYNIVRLLSEGTSRGIIGSGFVEKEKKTAARQMIKELIKEIRKVHR